MRNEARRERGRTRSAVLVERERLGEDARQAARELHVGHLDVLVRRSGALCGGVERAQDGHARAERLLLEVGDGVLGVAVRRRADAAGRVLTGSGAVERRRCGAVLLSRGGRQVGELGVRGRRVLVGKDGAGPDAGRGVDRGRLERMEGRWRGVERGGRGSRVEVRVGELKERLEVGESSGERSHLGRLGVRRPVAGGQERQ